ncbi:MAG: hypothetical protein HC933_02930 [Pleurocapsa sp. SU_196_0]|nr:hypothetical protein [Pleurocapsa sp. SU_196_0]
MQLEPGFDEQAIGFHRFSAFVQRASNLARVRIETRADGSIWVHPADASTPRGHGTINPTRALLLQAYAVHSSRSCGDGTKRSRA